MSSKKSVVVVGGGGAGHAIARTLSQKLDPATQSLTLVTARPFYTHLPAVVRMTTTSTGELESTALIPYDNLFFTKNGQKNGTLKIGKVTSIDAKEGNESAVVLESGERIGYDVLILAPGSQWRGPLNLPDDRESALAHIKEWRQKFENASNIVIAGGGAVGIEYAGEIKEFFPKKKVTIVHSEPQFLNSTYPDKFRKKLLKELRARGIESIFEDFIDDFEQTGTVNTRNGKQIEADLIIPAIGGQPNTGFISSLGATVLNERGQVIVKPTLQLKDFPNIYAAGDVTDWVEQKQLAKYAKHADTIVTNVLAYLKGAKVIKQYATQPELIVITIGPRGGAGYIGLAWGILVGGFLSAKMKSKELFIPMARKGLGIA